MTKTYVIPVNALDRVNKEIARVQRKAEKYGCGTISVEYGAPYATERSIYVHGEFTSELFDTELVEVVDVTITAEVVKKGEYSVIAYLEHCEEGNIVKAFTDVYRPQWNTMPGRCEHCGTKHHRVHTYIVSGADGEHQVGRACLMDYCGINPHAIGYSFELEDLFLDDMKGFGEYFSVAPRVYDTVSILAHAIDVFAEQGYVRTGEAGANRDVIDRRSHDNVSDEKYAAAKAMAAEIIDAEKDEPFLHNVAVMIKCGYCKDSQFGYVAYAPVAIKKLHEKKEREAARLAGHDEEMKSSYIGSIGERIVVDIKEMNCISKWENDYGYTYLYKMIDTNGNVLVWFASSPSDSFARAKMTVKGHNERDGVRQTVVNRCKAC